MLGEIDAVANLAVSDMPRARRFYETVLGLTPAVEQDEHMVTYRSGRTSLNVYRSDFAGTNKATAVTWAVSDIAAVVDALKDYGVRHIEMPATPAKIWNIINAGHKLAAE